MTHPRIFPKVFPAVILFFSCCSFCAFYALPLQAQVAAGPYRLVGTIKGKDVSGAVLIDPAGTQTFYRVREKLPDGSRITKIHDDVVSLQKEDGTSYDLYMIHNALPPVSVSAVPAQNPARGAQVPPVMSNPIRPDSGYQGYSGDRSPGPAWEAPSGDQGPPRRGKGKRRPARGNGPEE